MDELEVTISRDTMAAVREVLELEAEDRDGHLPGFLCVLLDDTEMTDVVGTNGGPCVRFRIYKLDWERIKAIADDALAGEAWDEAPAGKEGR